MSQLLGGAASQRDRVPGSARTRGIDTQFARACHDRKCTTAAGCCLQLLRCDRTRIPQATGGGLVLTKLPPAQASRGSRRRMRAREFSGGIPLEAREQHLGANRAVLERTSQAAAGNGIFVVGDRRPKTCLRDETYAQRRKSRPHDREKPAENWPFRREG